MHDHPCHCEMPIQAGKNAIFNTNNDVLLFFLQYNNIAYCMLGMWGGRAVLPEIKYAIHPNSSDPGLFDFWGDAKMLRDTIWPIIKKDVIHHDSYCCGKFNETIQSRPFPTRRASGTGEHVGSVYLPSLAGELRYRDQLRVLREKECNM